VNLTTTHKQAIVYKWYSLENNQLNISRVFNQNVQYPHAIDISMTEQNSLSKSKKKEKKMKGVY